MQFLTILSFVGALFTFLSIVLGFPLLNRFKGNLKKAVLYLLITLTLLLIRSVLRTFNTIPSGIINDVNLILSLFLTFFVLMALLEMKQLVKISDDNYYKSKAIAGKRKKKR